jgi:hypothetical protein
MKSILFIALVLGSFIACDTPNTTTGNAVDSTNVNKTDTTMNRTDTTMNKPDTTMNRTDTTTRRDSLR